MKKPRITYLFFFFLVSCDFSKSLTNTSIPIFNPESETIAYINRNEMPIPSFIIGKQYIKQMKAYCVLNLIKGKYFYIRYSDISFPPINRYQKSTYFIQDYKLCKQQGKKTFLVTNTSVEDKGEYLISILYKTNPYRSNKDPFGTLFFNKTNGKYIFSIDIGTDFESNGIHFLSNPDFIYEIWGTANTTIKIASLSKKMVLGTIQPNSDWFDTELGYIIYSYSDGNEFSSHPHEWNESDIIIWNLKTNKSKILVKRSKLKYLSAINTTNGFINIKELSFQTDPKTFTKRIISEKQYAIPFPNDI